MSTTVQAARAVPTSASRSRPLLRSAPARRGAPGSSFVLERYVDAVGCRRELVRSAAAAGSVLVIDRDAETLADRRLVAHLSADEPRENAAIVCAAYLQEPDPGRLPRVLAEDLECAPPQELEALAAEASFPEPRPAAGGTTTCSLPRATRGPAGKALGLEAGGFELLLCKGRASIPELCWHELPADGARPLSVREAVGSMQSYEPVRSLTASAVLVLREDPAVSVAALSVELERLNASRTVLNRGLRAAVLSRVRGGELTMSEIALRCGRVKRDRRGVLSGETSWLARRIGIASDSPGCSPTPWVHSDVLALIARQGLGVSPREVELG